MRGAADAGYNDGVEPAPGGRSMAAKPCSSVLCVTAHARIPVVLVHKAHLKT